MKLQRRKKIPRDRTSRVCLGDRGVPSKPGAAVRFNDDYWVSAGALPRPFRPKTETETRLSHLLEQFATGVWHFGCHERPAACLSSFGFGSPLSRQGAQQMKRDASGKAQPEGIATGVKGAWHDFDRHKRPHRGIRQNAEQSGAVLCATQSLFFFWPGCFGLVPAWFRSHAA